MACPQRQASRFGILASRLLATIVLAWLAGCVGSQPLLFDEHLRRATFDRYWSELDHHYPYFAQKGIDWQSERDRYRPLALAAPTPIEFRKVLVRMLSDLDDAHVGLIDPESPLGGQGWTRPPHALAVIGRHLYVEWLPGIVGTDSGAVRDHVPFASPELVAIDGFSVRRAWVADFLLRGAPGTQVSVRLAWPDGTTRDVTLERPREWTFSGPIPQPANVRRAGDVAYLGIRTFDPSIAHDGDGEALTAEIDALIAQVLDVRALIIDLQYNGGGQLGVCLSALARFMPTSAVIGRGPLRHWGPFEFEGDVEVEPRPPCFTGQLVILINAETASAAEWFALALRRERHAVLIGEQTAGAEAGVEKVVGPDGTTLVYGRRWLTDAQGRHLLQDDGVTPDVSIPLTLDVGQRVGYRRAQREVREQRLRAALERLGAGERFAEIVKPMLEAPAAIWECGRH